MPILLTLHETVFWCDTRQEVCPFNRPAATSAHPTLASTTEPAFQPREVTSGSTLADLLLMGEEEFRVKFKGSPVKRAKRRGLLRNVAVALANSDDPAAEQALGQVAASDPQPLVREHATWALRTIRERAEQRSQPRPDTKGGEGVSLQSERQRNRSVQMG